MAITPMLKKTIIVTGASKGIGKAIAEALKRDGYEVVAPTREELDLSNLASIRSFTDAWKRPLLGIVNNAGICKTFNITDVSENNESIWNEVIATNLTGPQLLVNRLAKHIVDDGRIINISSQLGKEGRAGYSAYCASKFGLIGLTKTWAKELGARGITVNAICPGWVDTEMSRKDMQRLAKEADMSVEAYYKKICEPLELKRFTKPEEVAEFVAFLVSPNASGITGRDMLMNTIWNQE